MATTSYKLTPRIINTFFLLALQEHFKHHSEYRWSHTDADTQIDITTDYSEDGRTQATVPSVVVQNGSCTITATGVGNGYTFIRPQTLNINGDVIVKEAMLDTKLTMSVSGYTQILIIGFSKDAVEELAFEVATLMYMIRSISGTILSLQGMADIQISQLQQLTQVGSSGKYQCVVVIPYTFNVTRTWSPVDTGVLLRSVETKLTPVNEDIYKDTGDYTADGKDDNTVELRFKSSLNNIPQ